MELIELILARLQAHPETFAENTRFLIRLYNFAVEANARFIRPQLFQIFRTDPVRNNVEFFGRILERDQANIETLLRALTTNRMIAIIDILERRRMIFGLTAENIQLAQQALRIITRQLERMTPQQGNTYAGLQAHYQDVLTQVQQVYALIADVPAEIRGQIFIPNFENRRPAFLGTLLPGSVPAWQLR